MYYLPSWYVCATYLLLAESQHFPRLPYRKKQKNKKQDCFLDFHVLFRMVGGGWQDREREKKGQGLGMWGRKQGIRKEKKKGSLK